jgi:hypothetical protein
MDTPDCPEVIGSQYRRLGLVFGVGTKVRLIGRSCSGVDDDVGDVRDL